MKVDLDKWYHCDVDKEEFVKLLKKSDYQGFKHMFIFFGSLIVFGVLAYMTWGTWWSLLFFLIYGNIWNCADPIWHETGHKTAFKTNYWNNFFYQIGSYMNGFEPVRWRWSHFRHHGYTYFDDPLDFEIAIRRPTDVFYFFSLFIPFFDIINFKKTTQYETILHALGKKTEVMKQVIPEREHQKCINSSRLHVGIWILLITISIAFQSWLPVLYFLLPNFYGITLKRLFGLTQHTGLKDNIKDHRYSTRTMHLNPIFSFLYWQMEYHIEHHMFPTVPSHNLPKLHQLVKDQMPPAKKGLWGAYSEIIPTIFKQAKDPSYELNVAVPNNQNA